MKAPELLAPVGGLEQLKAAVQNGADAVYFGGKNFNARMNAEHFQGEILKEAVEYAHLRNVKCYMTINTLIYDDEINHVLNQVQDGLEAGLDAFIIQDIALGKMLKKSFPNMSIHLSTQATTIDLQGVLLAAEAGFERVVLSRELSLEEIKEIKEGINSYCKDNKKKPVEVEVFVHGALCISYSGQCQISRVNGGRSGNRGTCAQSCRLPYELQEETLQPNQLASSLNRGFLLSPKDICQLDLIPQMIGMGIDSFKIEGRMKSPEYVGYTTKIYRKYIDQFIREGHVDVEKEDIEILRQIFSRGDFSNGYLINNPRKEILSGKLSKHQGIYIGEVTKNKTEAKGLIEVKLSKPLSLGDGIEIQNQNLAGGIVTYIKDTPKEKTLIGDIKGRANIGDLIYKISEKTLTEKITQTFAPTSSEQKKLLKKRDIYFHLVEGNPGEIMLYGGFKEDPYAICVSGNISSSAAAAPSTEERIIEQLGKLGGTEFFLAEATVQLRTKENIPVSFLNNLRREAVANLVTLFHNTEKDLAEEKSERGREYQRKTHCSSTETIEKADKRIKEKTATKKSLYLFSTTDEFGEKHILKYINLNYERIYLPYTLFLHNDIRRIIEKYNQNNLEIIPTLPAIMGRKEKENFSTHIESIARLFSISGVSLGNIGYYNAFQGKERKIHCDYGWNITNSLGMKMAKDMGFKSVALSLECINNEEFISKANMECYGMDIEIPKNGYMPVMHSAHCVVGDAIGCLGKNPQCEKGTTKYVLRSKEGKLNNVLTRPKDCTNYIFEKFYDRQEIIKSKLMNYGRIWERKYIIDERYMEEER